MRTAYVVIRPRDPEKIMHGRNVEILIDGKPMEYVSSVAFGVAAGEVAKLTIELVCPVELRGKFAVDPIEEQRHSETDPATGPEPRGVEQPW